MSSAKETHHKSTIQPRKKALLSRLKRAEGQVRGVAKMIEDDRYCIDILTQITALRSALDAVAIQLIEDHTKGCVKDSIRQGDDAAIDELITIVKRFAR